MQETREAVAEAIHNTEAHVTDDERIHQAAEGTEILETSASSPA